MGGIIETSLVWKALAEAAATVPDKRMYLYGREEITFRRMDEVTDRLASGLLRLGIRKGDRIGLIGLNQPEWLYTYFAAAKIGAVIVGFNVRYRDVELDYMLNQSAAKALVTVASYGGFDYVGYLDAFRERIPTVEHFLFIGGDGFHGSLRFEPSSRTGETQTDRAWSGPRPRSSRTTSS